ncbi:DUF6452 family protein [Paenimyroides aestuarii]|uniref:DUF6452 family protein n=1 Tax=Paenimyroides aestuarii TaxID=2968490 RepID=A0ABY5NR28_9FLAO|nr:DUF6452 family protein [Paenimyroides aestuarii]UUV20981.1 DUF6452 family protein [Paenimyroides aestuarii]
MKKITCAVLCLFAFSACEKDDICVGGESVTPNVVIDLFDRLDSQLLKPAPKISIFVEGYTDTIVFRNTSKIEIPLQINTTETVWNIRLHQLNSSNDTILKNDQLRFTYNPEAFYVSKACGYKTVFYNFNSVKLPNTSSDGWIENIFKVTNEISNNNNAHIQIYY